MGEVDTVCLPSFYNSDECFFQILNQTLDAIPTIATQLKIIAAVKASRQGGDGSFIRRGNTLNACIFIFNIDPWSSAVNMLDV